MTASDNQKLLTTGTVVIVEDDPLLQGIIAEMLSAVCPRCTVFGTADDALIYLISAAKDCVLLIADHGMPGQLNGTEFIAMCRAKWPQIPAIITSGYELPVQFLPRGVGYLQKPWPMELLLSTVARALSKAHDEL
jgi:CheY-like chemotaxis protein